MKVTQHPSPNFGERRGGARPDLIVLHYTAMASAKAALDKLCHPVDEVSAHYLIARDGQVLQLVEESQRAWHAGAGSWGACDDVNSRSIGIELDNNGRSPFSAPLMDATETLLRGIMDRWSITAERVIAHSDLAPQRKFDPGPRFDWRRLAQQGLAIWPDPDDALTPDPAEFSQLAHQFGYPECDTEILLAAFRSRFRPWAQGALDAADMSVISHLAKRFPVDAAPLTA